jgi:phosphoribosylformylglycinamidine synthase
MKPKAIILRTAGTNCDYETQAAFELAGADAERVHVNRLIEGETDLSDFQILAIPGGFSYGDDIASGKILANELKYKTADVVREFALKGNPIIGICNGFQVLVKMGLLPDPVRFAQSTTLTFNDSDKFECRWIYLGRCTEQGDLVRCLWTRDLPSVIPLPVAHGEGKFIALDRKTLDALEKNKQIVFRYVTKNGVEPVYPFNPNGAVNNIAGICNEKGNVFGLMPHPERFVYRLQHPDHDIDALDSEHGWGLQIFRNAVAYTKGR